ncbi:hypothetical protein AMAG_16111 [Allomyces macrogynus ATCC 38327]|uniref:U5 small nuclear ribonucleoprotein 200 kDa helicase n=1 Tax=Allomyces macrogynus (strain ATCC 38327) TaxID=578462 RepID=A0A0L0TAQ8_ALLM3|nr:hypothetical protein AMAG_16111 [Allomyces macrogynus ATCC 38327]|eukprot:KNE71806.1 hypothetical protein AMAG_16111 [Allomyces macrogynus ATCC 38327]
MDHAANMPFSLVEASFAVADADAGHLHADSPLHSFTYQARKAALYAPDPPAFLRSAIPGPSSLNGFDSPVDAEWDELVQRVTNAANQTELNDEKDPFLLIPANVLAELEQAGFESSLDVRVDGGKKRFDTAAWAEDVVNANHDDGGALDVAMDGVEPYSSEWLFRLCANHIDQQLALGADATLDLSTLFDTIMRILRDGASASSDAVSADLLEFLGYDSLPLITELVAHRYDILRAAKAERKADQLDDWKRAREEQLMRGPAPLPSGGIVDRSGPNYPHVFHTGGRPIVSTIMIGAKYALPAGSVQIDEPEYQEVVIPAAQQAPPLPEQQVITIDKLPKWIRPAYPGYKSLNKVQSLVYPIAFETNENMLVCAPTGAGKTDVAMLTVLRTISNYLIDANEGDDEDEAVEPVAKAPVDPDAEFDEEDDGGDGPGGFDEDADAGDDGPAGAKRPPVQHIRRGARFPDQNRKSAMVKHRQPIIAKNDFKIIYVAPMKALAAEVVEKFSKRLRPLGIQVRELTGDMQMTKQEILATQMIVTTPEKWDVVTRKATGDSELAQKVKLLIIDEVHLLHEDRGTVLETLVARTQRQVESTQSMIRIVGLSATLPNYIDVASFLRVNPYKGLFFFDNGFRPVPLTQHFLGIKGKTNSASQKRNLDRACFDKCIEQVRAGYQVMIFVHARKDTVRAAQAMRELAVQEDEVDLFDCTGMAGHHDWRRETAKSRNRELRELFDQGFGIHHAGMLRSDRSLTEKLFAAGMIKVLCCTATLAWGVNLPAHAVIIRGTDVYDAQKGAFVDVGILDVLQIFGRAGRPQFESEGVGYILTSLEKLPHYVSQMTQQHPIESQFASGMVDNLNAEISLGTVTTVDEAVQWLGYTYLYVRMRKNPVRYGIVTDDDTSLVSKRRELIEDAAKTLFLTNMIVYDPHTGTLASKDVGRIASNYYIKYGTVELVHRQLRDNMSEADVLVLLCACVEFDQIKLRESEVKELSKLLAQYCPCQIRRTQRVKATISGENNVGGNVKEVAVTDSATKINILLQSYISRAPLEDFALISDTMFVAQNAARILRAFFEFALNRSFASTCDVVLKLCKSVEHRKWPFEHPLSQFSVLPFEIIDKLGHLEHVQIEDLREMTPSDAGQLIRNQKYGPIVVQCAWQFPSLEIVSRVAPITSTVVELQLDITAEFDWLEAVHGKMQAFWIWVQDSDGALYHSEQILIHRSKHQEPVHMELKLPIASPPPPQLYVRWVSDTWIGAESMCTVTLDHLILPDLYTPHTDLLNLNPLPISALQNPVLEAICAQKFQFFNPIQTQVFHTLYHSRENVLLGAPTGSGKTVAAELAMWATFRDFPTNGKVVYIAPLKALVRERVDDWRQKLAPMNRSIVELTGDVTPDLDTILGADIIITTPEKWDGVSRNWRSRSYVQTVRTVIIDEIHLLGGERGPILEVIVSRMHYISQTTGNAIRIVGLSTALANARDLADWLGIRPTGLFNFRHSVRPVQLESYIDGFPGKHYCPRMATMNKPTYSAILRHSPSQPVIVFVSSRRQTRLTAQDLISYCCMDDQPKRFLKIDEDALEDVLARIKDTNLAHSLSFGIGLHHAGLTDSDRRIVEELFVSLKIQVLVATSTLAWGVNTPAHLVCIKGTEFYDAKKKKYVDFPITDVLQMMGRAGRPGYDDKGVACIFVTDSKKAFYKKFLHSPFPVESSLHRFLHDHMNAEIATGTIKSKQDALDYVTWTYFYRRLQRNPTYYDLVSPAPEDVNVYLSKMVDNVLQDLESAGCIELEGHKVIPTKMGAIGSFYYLQYQTLDHFHYSIRTGVVPTHRRLLDTLALAQEYAEIPVRHNEDLLNKALAEDLPMPVHHFPAWDSPHLKAHLLIQAHMSHAALPIVDYVTDTITVVDSSVRIAQAMIDVAVYKGLPETTLQILTLLQSIKQGQWITDYNLGQLPKSVQRNKLPRNVACIAQLLACPERALKHDPALLKYAANLPLVDLQFKVNAADVAAAAAEKTDGDQPGSEKADGVIDLAQERISGKPKPDPATTAANTVRITVSRRSAFPAYQTVKDTRIHAPRFPKVQYEGWYLLMVGPAPEGAAETGPGLPDVSRRVELRRFQFRERTRINATLPYLGKGSTLYLMCDGYQGLDQVFEL